MNKRIRGIGQSVGVKVVFIMAMVGLLAIFLNMQDSMVNERRYLRDQAVESTVTEWGGQQRVVGPILRVPYREILSLVKTADTVREGWAYLLPKDFQIESKLKGEKRQRGIYEVPLYFADISLQGSFVVPKSSDWFPRNAIVDWDNAELWFFLGSASGLAQAPKLLFAGKELESLRADSGSSEPSIDAFSARVRLPVAGETVPFSLKLFLKGGESFGVFPAGNDSWIKLEADQGFPEFNGSFLPLNRRLGEQGFSAEWKIPALARQIPSMGTTGNWPQLLKGVQFASFDLGVAFDSYRLINRALKYGLLFIIVPFIGLFLYEIFARRRLHPLQYLLVGCAVIMFYLLLLSISERLYFGVSFVAAGLAISGLIGVYCAAILQGGLKGLWCFLGMAGLYGLLYLIIGSEENALLVGSFFLFALLALVMMITRRLDWYGLGSGSKKADSVPISDES